MSSLDRIRQAFPELANASDSEVLSEVSRRTGASMNQIADTLGVKPSGVLYETGRQIAGGLVVDAPEMAGQAMKYYSHAGGVRGGEGNFPRLGKATGLERQYGVNVSEPDAAYTAGQALVEGAQARAPEWAPDMRGRGLLGQAAILGGRGVGAMLPTMAAMALPGGQVVAPTLQAALFGGSAAQDTYEKLISQGVSEEDASAAARRVWVAQGFGEGLATAGIGAAFRPAMAAVRGLPTTAKVAEAITDSSVLRPFAKGLATNMVLQPATEVAQDVGTSLIEQSYGAAPEDLGQIAKQSALGGAGMAAILGPLSIGGSAKRASRAASLRDALMGENTPPDIRAKAMDIVMGEARRQGVPEQDVGAWFDQQLMAEDARTEALRAAEQQAEMERRTAAINLMGGKAQQLTGLQGGMFSSLDQQRTFEQGLPNAQFASVFESPEQQRAAQLGYETLRDQRIANIGQQYQDLMGGQASALMQAQDIGQQAQPMLAPYQRGLESAQQAGDQWQELRAQQTRMAMDIDEMGQEWQKLQAELPQPVTGNLTNAQKAALRGPAGKRLKKTSEPIAPVAGGPMATSLVQAPQAAVSQLPAAAPVAGPVSQLTDRPSSPVSAPEVAAVSTPAAAGAAGGSLRRGKRGPVQAGDTVRVNDANVTLSTEQAVEWNAAQEAYDGKVRRAKAISNYQERESQLRAAGMQLSAERRRITGALTGKERATEMAPQEQRQLQSLIDAADKTDVGNVLPSSVQGANTVKAPGKASLTDQQLRKIRDALVHGREAAGEQENRIVAAMNNFAEAYKAFLDKGGKSLLAAKDLKKTAGTAVEERFSKLQLDAANARAALAELGEAVGGNAKNVEAVVRLVKDMVQGKIVTPGRTRAETIKAAKDLDIMLSQGWAAAKREVFLPEQPDLADVRGSESRQSREVAATGEMSPVEKAATEGVANPKGRGEMYFGLKGVLQHIRNTGTPMERQLAWMLREVIDRQDNDVKLEFIDTGNSRFDPATNTVYLSRTSSPEVSLHEAFHAALQSFVYKNPNDPAVQQLKRSLKAVVSYKGELTGKAKEVQDLLKKLVADKKELDAVLELVSYGTTLNDFRRALQAMPTKGVPASFRESANRVWSAIKNIASRMLGNNPSVASDVLQVSIDLLERSRKQAVEPGLGNVLEAAVQTGVDKKAAALELQKYKEGPGWKLNLTRTALEAAGFGEGGRVEQKVNKAADKFSKMLVKEFPGLAGTLRNISSKFGLTGDYKLAADVSKQERQTGLVEVESLLQRLYRNPGDALKVLSYLDGDQKALSEQGRDKVLRDVATAIKEHFDTYIEALPVADRRLFEGLKFTDMLLKPEGLADLAKKSFGMHSTQAIFRPEERQELSLDEFRSLLPFSEEDVVDSDKPLYQLFHTTADGVRSPSGFISADKANDHPELDIDRSRVWYSAGMKNGEYNFKTRNISGKNLLDVAKRLSDEKLPEKERDDAIQQISSSLLTTMAALSHNAATKNFFAGLIPMGRVDGKATENTVVFNSVDEINKVFDPAKKVTEGSLLEASDDESKIAFIRKVAQRGDVWVKLPDTDHYGPLRGKIIPGGVWSDMLDMHDRSPLFKAELLNDMLSAFKKNKTVFSPATHVNNILTNYAMMLMHGISHKTLWDAANLVVAYETRPGSLTEQQRALMKAFYKSGAVLGQFTNAETKAYIADKLAKNITHSNDKSVLDKLLAWGKVEKEFADYAMKAQRGLRLTDNFMSEVYAAGDNVFRLAAFMRVAGTLQEKNGGKLGAEQLQEAGLAARKMFLDYDIDARWVRAARQSVLPFVSWSYAIAPLLGRLAITRPWAMVNMMAAMYAMGAMGGADDDEWRKKGPDAVRERSLWGMGPYNMVRVPFMGTDDKPVYYNIGKSIPMMSLFEPPMGKAKLFGQSWLPGALQPSGPYVTLLANTFLNVDPFTGKQMYNPEVDTNFEKLASMGAAVWDTFAPSVASTRFLKQAKDVAQDKAGPTGEAPSALVLARTLGGLSLYQYDQGEVQFYQDKAVQNVKREFQAVMAKAKRDELAKGYPDYEALDAKLDDLRDRLDKRIAELRGED